MDKVVEFLNQLFSDGFNVERGLHIHNMLSYYSNAVTIQAYIYIYIATYCYK